MEIKECIPLKNSKVSWRREDGDKITLCIFKNCRYHIYKLNNLGTVVWELVDGKRNVEEIIQKILNERREKFKNLEKKVLSCLFQFKQYGLIKFKEKIYSKLFSVSKLSLSKEVIHLGPIHDIRERFSSPLEVILEVSQRCIRKCLHCYVTSANFQELSLDEFKIIIDKLSTAGVLIIHFTGGEPFLRKDFIEIVKYARSKNLRVHIDTNGILLDENIVRKLKELDIDALNIGFDGSNPDVYGITRSREDFDRVLANIQLVIKYGIPVIIFFCLHKKNYKDLHNLYRLCVRLGVSKISIDPYQPLNKSIAVRDKLYLVLFAKIAIKLYGLFISKLDTFTTNISWDHRCNMGLTTLGIHPDGTISPCIVINKRVGNLLSNDVKDVWNSDLIRKFITPAYYGEPCNYCFFPNLYWVKKRYLGKCPLDCRAEVFTLTEDLYSGNRNCILGKIIGLFRSRRK